MNNKDLYNVVEKLIVKRYPWIEDFEWVMTWDSPIEYYTLRIRPSKEFKDREIFMDKYEVEIEKDMKPIFDMLGPDKYQVFDKVSIYN